MRDRGRHLAHRGQARGARKLRTLCGLSFARRGELGEHIVEGGGEAADLVVAHVFGAHAVVPGLPYGGGDGFQPLQRSDDPAVRQDRD